MLLDMFVFDVITVISMPNCFDTSINVSLGEKSHKTKLVGIPDTLGNRNYIQNDF